MTTLRGYECMVTGWLSGWVGNWLHAWVGEEMAGRVDRWTHRGWFDPIVLIKHLRFHVRGADL